MATLYSDKRYNGEGTCWWRLRVDYSGTSATAYVDVGPTSGWSIWLYFTGSGNTFYADGKVWYGSDNGASGNKLGSMTISETASTTITQTCSGSTWGGNVNGALSVTIPAQKASYNLNILLPDGSEPYDTGAAGSVERSINSGTYERKYNEDASAYAFGTTFNYRNFTPGTGLELTSVSGVTPNDTTGPWSLTLNSGTSVNFQTGWKSYKVTYNANGGSTTPTQQTGTYNSTVTLASKISRANTDSNVTITVSYNANNGTGAPGNSTGTAVNTTPYTFSKWALGSTSGTKYDAGASYTIPASDSVMYATWTTGSTTRKSNPSITLSSTKPTRDGYDFLGWSTSSTATTASYQPGTAYTFSANTTLYAVWKATPQGNIYIKQNGSWVLISTKYQWTNR